MFLAETQSKFGKETGQECVEKRDTGQECVELRRDRTGVYGGYERFWTNVDACNLGIYITYTCRFR